MKLDPIPFGKHRTHIFVEHEPFHGNRVMIQIGKSSDGRYWRAKALELEEVTAETEHLRPEPTFTLDEGTAQELLERLYAIGLRPSHEVNERSALPFISAHLEDMRKLVFGGKESK